MTLKHPSQFIPTPCTTMSYVVKIEMISKLTNYPEKPWSGEGGAVRSRILLSLKTPLSSYYLLFIYYKDKNSK